MLYFKFDFPLHLNDCGKVIIDTQTYPCQIKKNGNVYILYKNYHSLVNAKLKDKFSYFRKQSSILKKFKGKYMGYNLSPEFETLDGLKNFIKYINNVESEI